VEERLDTIAAWVECVRLAFERLNQCACACACVCEWLEEQKNRSNRKYYVHASIWPFSHVTSDKKIKMRTSSLEFVDQSLSNWGIYERVNSIALLLGQNLLLSNRLGQFIGTIICSLFSSNPRTFSYPSSIGPLMAGISMAIYIQRDDYWHLIQWFIIFSWNVRKQLWRSLYNLQV